MGSLNPKWRTAWGLIVAGETNQRWLTKEGELLYVEEMSDSHLANARRMLVRKGYSPINAEFAYQTEEHDPGRKVSVFLDLFTMEIERRGICMECGGHHE